MPESMKVVYIVMEGMDISTWMVERSRGRHAPPAEIHWLVQGKLTFGGMKGPRAPKGPTPRCRKDAKLLANPP